MTKKVVDLLVKQREYGWSKEEWFVPLEKALEGLEAKEASWLPSGTGNTIWQTVNHVNYFNERILASLKGEDMEPEIPNDETFGDAGDPNDTIGWNNTLEKTRNIANDLTKTLRTLNDEMLEEMSLTEELPQWILHDSYHTGQIMLIRKEQGSWPLKR